MKAALLTVCFCGLVVSGPGRHHRGREAVRGVLLVRICMATLYQSVTHHSERVHPRMENSKVQDRVSRSTIENLSRAVRHAVRLHTSGKLEAAVDAYRAILKRHPESGACWSNLGAVLREAGPQGRGLGGAASGRARLSGGCRSQF